MGSLGQILNKGGRKERLESEKSDSIMALNLLSKLFQPVAFFFSPFPFLFSIFCALSPCFDFCASHLQVRTAEAPSICYMSELGNGVWQQTSNVSLCLKGAYIQKVARDIFLTTSRHQPQEEFESFLLWGLPTSKYLHCTYVGVAQRMSQDFQEE